MEELKIFEVIEFSFIVFILNIILEAKIEYMDSFNEEDILVIYQDSFSALQKLYEIIMLMLLLNGICKNKKNNNNDEEKNMESISFECLCEKYVNDFYKY